MADPIKDPADAGSHREFADNPIVKSILNGTPRPAVTPLKVESEAPPENKEADPDPGQGEPAGTSGEPAKKPSQEKKDERKEHGADARIKALNAEAKANRERAERAEARLAELERGAPKTEPAKPEAPKPQQLSVGEDPEPDADAMMADPQYKTVGEAIRDFNRKWNAWNQRQSEKQTQEQHRKTVVSERDSKIQAKYPDDPPKVTEFLNAIGGLPRLNSGLTFGLERTEDSDSWAEVVHYLVNNLEEAKAINALPPEKAHKAILRLEIRLSGEQPPEQPTEPKIVSRAPAPIERASGNSVNLDRDPQKATSQRDFEQKLSPALREMAGFPKRR